jgi:hypothetical protein
MRQNWRLRDHSASSAENEMLIFRRCSRMLARLRALKEIEMARTRIGFGLDLIPASVIAKQWYCEKAVDLSYRYSEIEISSPVFEQVTLAAAEKSGDYL